MCSPCGPCPCVVPPLACGTLTIPPVQMVCPSFPPPACPQPPKQSQPDRGLQCPPPPIQCCAPMLARPPNCIPYDYPAMVGQINFVLRPCCPPCGRCEIPLPNYNSPCR